LVVKLACEVVATDKVDVNEGFFDLGFDSLMTIELRSKIERAAR
jgi:acyl carrier protein